MDVIKMNKFVIFSSGYNASEYVEGHIKSIQNQFYKNYVHIIIDDASTDDTYDKAVKLKDDKTFIYRNNNNIKWISNALKYLDKHIENDEDIIVLVDLDDRLMNSNVLHIVNNAYIKSKCWMTYSRFLYSRHNTTSEWIPIYSKYHLDNKMFRKHVWSFTHLRTFKAFLWKHLNKEDLKGPDGQYVKYSYDRFLCLPMLEMSSPSHITHIPEILYIYNDINPLQVEKLHRKEQELLAYYADIKKPYKTLRRK
jgi:glycosyltransferase involved in cell wall biosynthesis